MDLSVDDSTFEEILFTIPVHIAREIVISRLLFLLNLTVNLIIKIVLDYYDKQRINFEHFLDKLRFIQVHIYN